MYETYNYTNTVTQVQTLTCVPMHIYTKRRGSVVTWGGDHIKR